MLHFGLNIPTYVISLPTVLYNGQLYSGDFAKFLAFLEYMNFTLFEVGTCQILFVNYKVNIKRFSKDKIKFQSFFFQSLQRLITFHTV